MVSSEVDDDALRRAMAITRRDPSRAMQLDEVLRDEPWTEVAEFAAFHCHIQTLGLKPWQLPPCSIEQNDPRQDNKDAQRLLRRMLAAGVSRYEPDPLAALKQKAKAGERVASRFRFDIAARAACRRSESRASVFQVPCITNRKAQQALKHRRGTSGALTSLRRPS